jgi:hypothetical protein
MKATKLFSIAILFSLAFISCQKEEVQPQNMQTNNDLIKSKPDENPLIAPFSTIPRITYQVIVHNLLGVNLCNPYSVRITDVNGRIIAEKPFDPAISVYEFSEPIPVSAARIARLDIAVQPRSLICPLEISTKPDEIIMERLFKVGVVYTFDLFPRFIQNTNPAKTE